MNLLQLPAMSSKSESKMAFCRMTYHQCARALFTFVVVLISITVSPVTPATPATLAGPGLGLPQQPVHYSGSSSHKPDGMDSFQTGMIIGFVTFAVLALCMMLLILYFLVRGTRRELRKAQVELAELRQQRHQELAAERLQGKGRASELRCIVDQEDDSSDLVNDENERDDGVGYDYQPPPSPPAYDNYTYVAMEAQRNGRPGRKKRKANDRIVEN